MRKAMHTRPLTISLCDEDYERVKQITDEKKFQWRSGSELPQN